MDEKKVSVKMNFTVEDYCTIQNQHTFMLRIIISILLPILTFSTILFLTKFAMPGCIFIICAMVISILFLMFYLPKSMKKKWVQQYNNNKLIQKEQHYLIKVNGIECFSDTGHNRYTWSDLYSFRETDEAFYIYISLNQLYYIPKKSFNNNEADLQFVRECFAKLPEYKKNRPQTRIKTNLIVLGIIFLFIFFTLLIVSFISSHPH